MKDSRNFLAVLAGLVTGFIIISLAEYINHLIFPLPGELNMKDPDSMKIMMNSLPATAFLIVILGYILGAFGGGFVAAKVAAESKMKRALIVGFVLMLAGLSNLLMLPQPIWFTVVSTLVYIPSAWLGGKVAL